MKVKDIVLVIRSLSTEQINMLMTKTDYEEYIAKLTKEASRPTSQIHFDDLSKTNGDKTLSNWAEINFLQQISISARYCYNEAMLVDFLNGEYNDYLWYFDKDNVSHECFDYILKGHSGKEKQEITKDVISGYTIINQMEFRDKYGSFSSVVMGHNENAAAPWVTWRYFPEYDNYEFEHYFTSEDKAMKDFFERGLELTSVDLRDEYRNEMIIADIKEALSYDYHDSKIADLMADEGFVTKAIESWHSIDRSDENDILLEKLNEIVEKTLQNHADTDKSQTYTIKITSAMDTEAGYLKVRNISKDKIKSIAIGVCVFEEEMEIGFDGLLKNAGADILGSWEEDPSIICDYDMEFCWDVPMLYDNLGNKMFEYPLDHKYDDMILYGIKNDTFHIVWEHVDSDDYYSYCMIDSTPDDMEFDTVCKFIEQNINEGSSISGTKEEILAEIDNNLSSMDDVRYVKSSHKVSEPSFIYKKMEKEIPQLSNSKIEDKEL